jgi:hypothetical protein
MTASALAQISILGPVCIAAQFGVDPSGAISHASVSARGRMLICAKTRLRTSALALYRCEEDVMQDGNSSCSSEGLTGYLKEVGFDSSHSLLLNELSTSR